MITQPNRICKHYSPTQTPHTQNPRRIKIKDRAKSIYLFSLSLCSLFLYLPHFVERKYNIVLLPRDLAKTTTSLRPSTRTDVRKKSYKIGVDANEVRRRREDNFIEIRKNKREDNLLKKRREGLLFESQTHTLFDAAQHAANVEKRAIIKANIVLPLVSVLQHAEFDIKKEAAWAISNATSGGSHEQIQFLVSQGCIRPLCDLICPDPRIVTACLEGLENILKVGEVDKEMGKNGGVNVYAQTIDECGELEKIENLQTHDNDEIYEKAMKILERYWVEEEEGEQTVQDGVDGTQQGFPFGANRPNVPQGGFKFG